MTMAHLNHKLVLLGGFCELVCVDCRVVTPPTQRKTLPLGVKESAETQSDLDFRKDWTRT